MTTPTLRPPGLIVDPNWASSTAHPCHALAGTIKAAVVLASDGTVYDASGLNTLSSVLVDSNGFAVTIAQTATLNALKSISTDYTLLVVAGITATNTTTAYNQNGFKFFVYHYGTGNDYTYQYGGIGGKQYANDHGVLGLGKAGGTQNRTILLNFTGESDTASQTPRAYTASYRSDGSFSTKTDLCVGGVVKSTLASYAGDGADYESSTYFVPGSASSTVTLAQYASTVEWCIGGTPDATNTPAIDTRARLGVVFSAPANEAMMDYLIAHPDEMLIAGMAMSPPPPPPPPPVGVSPPPPPPPPPVGVAPVAAPAGIMETYSFPRDGYPIRDTTGAVVIDAALTIIGVTDCKTDAPVVDSNGLAISLTDTTAISVEYALFGGVSYGGCCAMYDVQRYGDAHLCIMPVKAGHTFLALFTLMRATVSNNDLSGIGQVAIDALNSSTNVLTAAVGAQMASARVSSAFVTQGQAVVLGADTVSNITNLLPTSASIQAADTAALTASGLTTGSVSSMIAKLSQIDDAEWGTITKNLDGSYSVAEIAAAGVTRGQVYQTYDNTGKLVTKTVTGLL